MCQRFDVTGNLKNFAKFFETKQDLGGHGNPDSVGGSYKTEAK
jgi:hypothetical protein